MFAPALRSTVRRAMSVVALFSLVAGTGCMMFAKPPASLNYSRARVSEGGTFRAAFTPDGDSIPQGKLQRWTLHLESASGAPIDSATISVDGGMPQHGHGLPTKPRATRALGGGDHLIEGMKFNMGGWWVVKFRVATTAGKDSVVFNIKL